MRKLLVGLLALTFLALALPAEAGWNLRQNDDGTTEWIRSNSANVDESRQIGEVYLTVLLEDVADESTVYITIPVNDMRVSYIQTVLHGDLATQTGFIDFWRLSSAGTKISQITNQVTGLALSAAAITGEVDTFTPTNGLDANIIEKDQVIAIHSDGTAGSGSGATTDITITITLVPR